MVAEDCHIEDEEVLIYDSDIAIVESVPESDKAGTFDQFKVLLADCVKPEHHVLLADEKWAVMGAPTDKTIAGFAWGTRATFMPFHPLHKVHHCSTGTVFEFSRGDALPAGAADRDVQLNVCLAFIGVLIIPTFAGPDGSLVSQVSGIS